MPAPALDVWFVTAEQVYRGVPFNVAAGWVEQGRLAASDKTRPAGTTEAWTAVSAHPLLADYLPLPAGAAVPAAKPTTTEPLDPPDEPLFRKRADDDDDDVDMIPLIDVSLVLLVFFMMTTTIPRSDGSVSVPEVKYGMEIRPDDPAVVVVMLNLRDEGDAYYAVRVGNQGVRAENNNLQTLAEVKARLDEALKSTPDPPEVRIACDKRIKHVRVRELNDAIDPYRRSGQITSIRAEVNEQPK